jgi:hypothetical protein
MSYCPAKSRKVKFLINICYKEPNVSATILASAERWYLAQGENVSDAKFTTAVVGR